MKLIGLLRLIRLHYSLPLTAGLSVIVLYVVGGNLSVLPSSLPWACLALFGVIAGAYALNDVCDMASDRINHPQRVLMQGTLERSTALTWANTLLFSGLLCCFACPLRFRIGLGLVALGLILYNLCSKRLGFMKDLWVATLTTSLYPLAFTLADPMDSPRLHVLWFHPFWFFLTTVAYEMLKDIRDIPGDQAVHPTTAHYSAQPWFHRLYPIVIALSLVFLLPPWLLGYCGWIYLVAIIGTILCGLIAMKASVPHAIHCLYLAVVLVTLGSLLDLLRQTA